MMKVGFKSHQAKVGSHYFNKAGGKVWLSAHVCRHISNTLISMCFSFNLAYFDTLWSSMYEQD